MKLLAKWLICFGALIISAYCFPAQFTVKGGLFSLAVAATVLWLVNLTLRPLIRFVSIPITVLTFGLFSLVINAAMVKLTDLMLPVIQIRGFLPCFVTALLISAAGSAIVAKR